METGDHLNRPHIKLLFYYLKVFAGHSDVMKLLTLANRTISRVIFGRGLHSSYSYRNIRVPAQPE